MDRALVELNRASTERIQALAARLTDEQMLMPIGQHWTPGVVFAHIAFWDRRCLLVLDQTEAKGQVSDPGVNTAVNDLSLPLWAAIPPREAAAIAIETARALDERLEKYPEELLEEIWRYNERWVDRSRHRGEHLDEVDVALKG